MENTHTRYKPSIIIFIVIFIFGFFYLISSDLILSIVLALLISVITIINLKFFGRQRSTDL
jgi:hypothetical protein